ncbi:MAG: AraC family transcriptional regulator [Gammaproteobacteria bacterium]|nr:AraC family transcriptional regulator [Gammaproteobacteria bacterium]
MQKDIVKLKEIKLVGITTRTNNASLFESNPETNKVAATVQKYFYNRLAEKIQHRKHPGKTFCVYTNYESDFNGDYTYFIGEEVNSFEELSDGFETITIPQQAYTKFTNQSGPMPTVCIEMWKAIWLMKPSDLGGKRSYIADFEIYDERSHDHQNVVLDIYVGINEENKK